MIEGLSNGAERVEQTCKWTRWDDHEDNIYDTECGQTHEFVFDGPTENMHVYCPYCGREIEEVRG